MPLPSRLCSHQECQVQDPGRCHCSGASPPRGRSGHTYSQKSGVLRLPHGASDPLLIRHQFLQTCLLVLIVPLPGLLFGNLLTCLFI